LRFDGWLHYLLLLMVSCKNWGCCWTAFVISKLALGLA